MYIFVTHTVLNSESIPCTFFPTVHRTTRIRDCAIAVNGRPRTSFTLSRALASYAIDTMLLLRTHKYKYNHNQSVGIGGGQAGGTPRCGGEFLVPRPSHSLLLRCKAFSVETLMDFPRTVETRRLRGGGGGGGGVVGGVRVFPIVPSADGGA